MKVDAVVEELRRHKRSFSGKGNYVLYVNTTNCSITIWEVNRALQNSKSKFTNQDLTKMRSLAHPDEIRSTSNGAWLGPFTKFEALGFAEYLNNLLYQAEKKTFAIDYSKC
jgi:hypothetical protein